MKAKKSGYRKEKDVLGSVNVPKDAYYGSETQRAVNNFQISGMKIQSEFIKNYVILKRCAAVANMKIGKLDKKKYDAIIKACDYLLKGNLSDQFVVDVFQAGAGTSVNMNVNEVLANKAIEYLGGKKGDYKLVHPNDHVNMSQSTNDTFHSVIHITSYSLVGKQLLKSLRELEKTLYSKSKSFSKIIKVGRTHIQDAVPMTLGEEFMGYAGSMTKMIKNIEDAAALLLYVPMGGTAIGTGIDAPKAYAKEFIKEFDRYTKMNFKLAGNRFASMQNQEAELRLSDSLKETAVAISKIANDLRLLGSGPRTGISELRLPEAQPGSSIMPGKINPSICEMMNMVCFNVIGSNETISQAAAGGQLELNVFMPIIAYNLVLSIKIMSNGISTFNEKCVKGVTPNYPSISEHAKMNLSIVTALVPYIGYAKSAEIARIALKKGKSIKQICMEMKIMDEKKLDKILNTKRMV